MWKSGYQRFGETMFAARRNSRGNALWGRGDGRPGGRLAFFIVVMACLAASAATASPGRAAPGHGRDSLKDKSPTALADAAAAQPNGMFRVIVQGRPGVDAHVDHEIAKNPGPGGSAVVDHFTSISGVAAELTGAQLTNLGTDNSVLTITPDVPVTTSAGPGGDQQTGGNSAWRAAVGVDSYKPARGSKPPAIAIVDSGIDPKVTGIDPVASVSLYSGTSPQSLNDGYGHGSFVAGLAASPPGRAAGNNPGAAPNAPVVSIDVVGDNGESWTSDLIRACDWILQNKGTYNIRVANFSLQSSVPSSFLYDPLDAAVERVWASGVTVVAAAGNYAQAGAQSGVTYAPANDPFVITVGALDPKGTSATSDDTAAPWSAWGHTPDGFMKPELGAPGRYMVGNVGDNTTLMQLHGQNKLAPNKLELSGTSFAAPIVAGIADDLLNDHPNWTPDQVKGALMVSAQPTAQGNLQLGVGEASFTAADVVAAPPNPNAGLDAFVSGNGSGSAPVFDTAAWSSAAWSSAAWASAAWSSAAWASAAWSSAAWASAAWSSNADADGLASG
jgi:serine protease AprX